MKAVITVIGQDTVGIIYRVSGICANHQINILDITQSVMQDIFTMTMLVEIDKMDISFTELVDRMNNLGKDMNLEIRTMHEDIFNSMHKI